MHSAYPYFVLKKLVDTYNRKTRTELGCLGLEKRITQIKECRVRLWKLQSKVLWRSTFLWFQSPTPCKSSQVSFYCFPGCKEICAWFIIHGSKNTCSFTEIPPWNKPQKFKLKKVIIQTLEKIMKNVHSGQRAEHVTSASLWITGHKIFLHFLTFLEICAHAWMEALFNLIQIRRQIVWLKSINN